MSTDKPSAGELERLRRLAQSHAEYWRKIKDPTPEHAEMAASQMQHLANALAALRPPVADAGMRETLKQILVNMIQRNPHNLIVVDYETTVDLIIAAFGESNDAS